MALRLRVSGLVQGVGFRPYIWRLAQAAQLTGTVRNDGQGVLVEVWGGAAALQQFQQQLLADLPPLARIDSVQVSVLDLPCPSADFRILASESGLIQTGVVPDAALCAACRDDMFDPTNRRYRYPFTNCTHCGPRLSIVQRIPYDRANTSMHAFPQCPACLQEYGNPADRRFHAQPNACPACGPQVWLEDAQGQAVLPSVGEQDCVDTASRLLRDGAILALMGLGGVHLVCDASNPAVVARLRQRKRRYQKPLALMARDLEVVRQYAQISKQEAGLLQAKEAGIVLLPRIQGATEVLVGVSAQPALGFMLPYTPLHALLLSGWDTPLVMTSANLSEEPQCISVEETRLRMQGMADYLLLHDRPILNRVDDSVLRVVAGKPRLLRRARGYAPAPLLLPEGFAAAAPVLALGGELKSTIALLRDGQAILSQHLGDLEDARTWREYLLPVQLYQQLFAHQPQAVVVDLHPGYRSSQWGQQWAQVQGLALIEVQHHHAHIAACLAENGWPLHGGKVLGIVLDGLGYGDDGTIWGGEFLLADYAAYTRVGHFKQVPLPGGTQAILQPWRNTWAQLQALGWADVATQFAGLELIQYLQAQPLATLETMLARQLNSPLTSSCGRLFDAVAAALGCCREGISYEGQAAIELEALLPDDVPDNRAGYPFAVQRKQGGCVEIDPAPMWFVLLQDLQDGTGRGRVAARFHHGLLDALVTAVSAVCAEHPGIQAIALSGGVFQNVWLYSELLARLEQVGKPVLSHSRVPTNDGGLSLGQGVIGQARLLQVHPACICP